MTGIREAIKNELKKNGVTQVSLAKKIGVSQATIYKVLNTDTKHTVETIEKMTRYFGLLPAASSPCFLPAPPPARITDLIQKTVAILESDTPFAAALKENIEAFYYGMNCIGDLNVAQVKINEHEERLKAVESKLSFG